MADDEDARRDSGADELFAPPGPRRSSYTPPSSDPASLEAAANIFNDDAIAQAMADELAKMMSGPISIVRPPAAVEEPVAAEPEPVAADEVKPFEPPAAVEEPVVADEPVVAEEPAQVESPAPAPAPSIFAPPPAVVPAPEPVVSAPIPPVVASAPAPFWVPSAADIPPAQPSPFAPPASAYRDEPTGGVDAPIDSTPGTPQPQPGLSFFQPPAPPETEATPLTELPPPSFAAATSTYDPPAPAAETPAPEAPAVESPAVAAEPPAPASEEAAPAPQQYTSPFAPPPFAPPPADSPATPPEAAVSETPAQQEERPLYFNAPAPTVPPADDVPPPPGYTSIPSPYAPSSFAPSSFAPQPEPTQPSPVEPAISEESASPDRRPERMSLDDDELFTTIDRNSPEAGGTLGAIEQLQQQLEMRDREAREFAAWQNSMLALGTPEAIAAVEQARSEFAGASGTEQPSSAEPPVSIEPPAFEQPVVEQPASEQPASEQPASEQPPVEAAPVEPSPAADEVPEIFSSLFGESVPVPGDVDAPTSSFAPEPQSAPPAPATAWPFPPDGIPTPPPTDDTSPDFVASPAEPFAAPPFSAPPFAAPPAAADSAPAEQSAPETAQDTSADSWINVGSVPPETEPESWLLSEPVSQPVVDSSTDTGSWVIPETDASSTPSTDTGSWVLPSSVDTPASSDSATDTGSWVLPDLSTPADAPADAPSPGAQPPVFGLPSADAEPAPDTAFALPSDYTTSFDLRPPVQPADSEPWPFSDAAPPQGPPAADQPAAPEPEPFAAPAVFGTPPPPPPPAPADGEPSLEGTAFADFSSFAPPADPAVTDVAPPDEQRGSAPDAPPAPAPFDLAPPTVIDSPSEQAPTLEEPSESAPFAPPAIVVPPALVEPPAPVPFTPNFSGQVGIVTSVDLASVEPPVGAPEPPSVDAADETASPSTPPTAPPAPFETVLEGDGSPKPGAASTVWLSAEQNPFLAPTLDASTGAPLAFAANAEPAPAAAEASGADAAPVVDVLGTVAVDQAGVAVLSESAPIPLVPPVEPEVSAPEPAGSAMVLAPIVAPAASTRPKVFAVELSGAEPTPLDQRVGRAARLFWLWFAANSSLVAVVFGGLVFSLGMSLRQSIVATLAGVAISFLPLGLGTLAGKRSGQPTMVISRATFGVVGNILPAVIGLLSRLFWGAALLWIIGAGTASVLVSIKATDGFSERELTIAVMAIAFILAVVIAYFGYGLIAKVQLVLSIVSAIAILGFIALTYQRVNIMTALSNPDGSWVLIVTGAVLVFSFVGLAWANSSSDLARHQRPGSSGATSMLWATFGTALPTFVLITYGSVLAASSPAIASGLSSRPLVELGSLLPAWYPAPLIAATALSLLSGVVVSTYSAGFSLQAVGVRVSRPAATVIVAVLLLAVALTLTFTITDFTSLFRDFATTLAVPVAAWAGMFAAETMIRNRRFDSGSLLKRGGVYADVRWGNLIALVVIIGIGFGLTSATVGWLSWEGYLFQVFGVPLTGDVAATDLGVLVALVLGLFTPVVGGIPAIRRQERALAPAPE